MNLGLYRDDGLGVSSSTPRQIENSKKKICELFKKHGLSITISANTGCKIVSAKKCWAKNSIFFHFIVLSVTYSCTYMWDILILGVKKFQI